MWWLMASFFAAILPHLWPVSSHTPKEFVLALAVVLVWRALMANGKLGVPSRVLKTVLVVASTALVVMSFRGQVSLDSATTFLAAASTLKLLELRTARDARILMALSYGLLATAFLFEQGILTAVYGVVVVWHVTASLIMLHEKQDAPSNAARTSAWLLLVSLPFMLVFYVLFPRIAPLWTLTLQTDKAITGLSDSISPGDIAELSQSDELAFRASFSRIDGQSGARFLGDSPPIARSQMYWRALVLDAFDGRRWQVGDFKPSVRWHPSKPSNAIQNTATQLARWEVDVVQQASGQTWLFGLSGSVPDSDDVGRTDDDLLRTQKPLFQSFRYRVRWSPSDLPEQVALTSLERHVYTELPKGSNPLTARWAQRLWLGSQGAKDFLTRVMRHFQQQPFFYTLRPPKLGRNSVDEFLFQTRRGFCSHYASAMAVIARSVGLPARLVSGYQGGEWQGDDGYVSVRQYDAHAWLEIWLPKHGWQRFDPTAMVAPHRIERGLQDAVRDEGTFLQDRFFSTHKYKNLAWLTSLRTQFERANYYWQRWVLSYNRDQQQRWLQQWFGQASWQSVGYLLACVVAALLLVGMVWLWWQRPRTRLPQWQREWHALQKSAYAMGVVHEQGVSPHVLLDKLAEHSPKLRDDTNALMQQLNAVVYAQPAKGNAPDTQASRMLAKRIRRLRKRC